MTGYGQSSFFYEQLRFDIELRSTNSRYLETIYDFPAELSWFEPLAHDLLKKKVQRGRIQARIVLDKAFPKTVVLNQDLINQYQILYQELSGTTSGTIPFNMLAQLPGIFELKAKDWRTIKPKLEFYYLRALIKMQRSRRSEGKKIVHWLKTHLRYLNRLNRKIDLDYRNLRKKNYKKLRHKLMDLIWDEGEPLQKNMLLLARKVWAQYRDEIVNLIQSDIEEEIQRIEIHIKSILELLASEKAEGKQLDFYLQEIQREVNTLAAKASDTNINRTAVLMKIETEKMREQVRNLE
ncbi:MAG: DUF1732 domain-containing protein [Leptospiraceae bacterium]|nr:DUF1732 domain-containing protein [Leptospiraceae bacterium]MDW8306332.1 DUF1732 domain-containing protein [Leptospiraceae bacterium]